MRQRIGDGLARWNPRDMDRFQLGIVAALVTLVLVAVFPRVYPAAQQGPQCSELANPLGGNNRSILAQKGDLNTALDLQLALDDTNLQPGEALKLKVTFVNKHIGPTILWLNRTLPPASRFDVSQQQVYGLTFEITRVQDNTTLRQQIQVTPIPAVYSYDYEELHLLGSHGRCTESYTIGTDVLGSIGAQNVGSYRIRAYYTIDDAGDLPAANTTIATATATPAYNDQGVWVGQASSNEVTFSVNVVTTAPVQ